jgi:hypothetical protein
MGGKNMHTVPGSRQKGLAASLSAILLCGRSVLEGQHSLPAWPHLSGSGRQRLGSTVVLSQPVTQVS